LVAALCSTYAYDISVIRVLAFSPFFKQAVPPEPKKYQNISPWANYPDTEKTPTFEFLCFLCSNMIRIVEFFVAAKICSIYSFCCALRSWKNAQIKMLCKIASQVFDLA
jgi:hypothetical protein